jgi:hypothetical protein
MGAAIPPFSAFSATSELAVTAAVFYVFFQAYYRDRFRGALLAITVSFEVVVNVAYMVNRFTTPSAPLSNPALQVLLAAHGVLSLAMLLFLIVFATGAWMVRRDDYNLFRQMPATTLTFIVLWAISIVSGEAAFVWAYLIPS